MRRGPIFVAAAALACLPAVTGLVGNQSFSHSVPVRVPSQARIGSPDAKRIPLQQPARQHATGSPTAEITHDDQRGRTAAGQPAGQPAEVEHFSPVPSPLPRPESSRTSGKGADDGRPAEKSSDRHGGGASGDDTRGRH